MFSCAWLGNSDGVEPIQRNLTLQWLVLCESRISQKPTHTLDPGLQLCEILHWLGLTIALDYSESFLCKSVQLYFSIVIGNKVKCVFENIAICFWTPSLHESTDSSTIHWSILPFLDLRCAALNHRNLLSYRLIFAYCFLWSQAIRVALSSCWCLTSNQSQWLSPFNLPLFAITQLAWMSLQYSSICSFSGLAILYNNAGFPTVE